MMNVLRISMRMLMVALLAQGLSCFADSESDYWTAQLRQAATALDVDWAKKSLDESNGAIEESGLAPIRRNLQDLKNNSELGLYNSRNAPASQRESESRMFQERMTKAGEILAAIKDYADKKNAAPKKKSGWFSRGK